MAKSVDTKYSTTPEEKIFGVDPFQAMSNTTLNSIVSKKNSFGVDVSHLLGHATNISLLAGAVSVIQTGKLDKKYIMDKLGSTLKLDTSFLANTKIASAGKLLQSMGLVDDKTANLLSGKDSSMSLVDIYTTAHNGYKTTVKNVKKVGDGFEQMGKDLEKYVKDDLFDSFSNFTKAIGAINPEIANLVGAMGLGEELAMLRDVVQQTVALEIPGLVDLIINDIKDEKTQKVVLAQSIPMALDSSNVEVLTLALDIVGADTIRGMYPDIVSDILKGYRESADDVGMAIETTATNLFELLDKVDPKWAYTSMNGTWALNLDVFRDMSPAAKRVIINSDNVEYRSVAMIGGLYKPEKPLVIAKKYYPYI